MSNPTRKVRVLRAVRINERIRQRGEILDYSGPPSPHLHEPGDVVVPEREPMRLVRAKVKCYVGGQMRREGQVFMHNGPDSASIETVAE